MKHKKWSSTVHTLFLVVLILLGSISAVWAFILNQPWLACLIALIPLGSILSLCCYFHCAKKCSAKGKDSDLDSALDSLKEAKQQLVSQEKMAAIGILAAGVAHEIKNPLNFINNFSDITVDLIDDLHKEMEKPLSQADQETKDALNDIVGDIASNCKKINEHGKRAESIIKNMLIQSRTSSVEKTPLDINDILEEFINLSYHGMRAQNNTFNAKIEKDFDKEIQPILANQQSLGRVMLNIINNGLYAANEKAVRIKGNFMPTISISTEQNTDSIIIKIKDNGNGIPENLRRKIFEPFFTTKPAGDGTGLGLPLCYDIVVKEHGGSINILSSPGEFTEFIIQLPKGNVV